MQQLIDKALALNQQRHQAEEEKVQARLAKEYEDVRIMLRGTLGDDAQVILENAEPFYYGQDREDHSRGVWLKSGDWLFDDGGSWSNKMTCRLMHIENYLAKSWTSDWETFTDLADFGKVVESQLHKLERRQEMEARQAEREEQLKRQSPYWYSVNVFRQLIFDIEANKELSTPQRLVVALVELFQEREAISVYSPESDQDEDENEEL